LVLHAVPDPGRHEEQIAWLQERFHPIDAVEPRKVVRIRTINRRPRAVVAHTISRWIQYREVAIGNQRPALDATDIDEEERRRLVVQRREGILTANED